MKGERLMLVRGAAIARSRRSSSPSQSTLQTGTKSSTHEAKQLSSLNMNHHHHQITASLESPVPIYQDGVTHEQRMYNQQQQQQQQHTRVAGGQVSQGISNANSLLNNTNHNYYESNYTDQCHQDYYNIMHQPHRAAIDPFQHNQHQSHQQPPTLPATPHSSAQAAQVTGSPWPAARLAQSTSPQMATSPVLLSSFHSPGTDQAPSTIAAIAPVSPYAAVPGHAHAAAVVYTANGYNHQHQHQLPHLQQPHQQQPHVHPNSHHHHHHHHHNQHHQHQHQQQPQSLHHHYVANNQQQPQQQQQHSHHHAIMQSQMNDEVYAHQHQHQHQHQQLPHHLPHQQHHQASATNPAYPHQFPHRPSPSIIAPQMKNNQSPTLHISPQQHHNVQQVVQQSAATNVRHYSATTIANNSNNKMPTVLVAATSTSTTSSETVALNARIGPFGTNSSPKPTADPQQQTLGLPSSTLAGQVCRRQSSSVVSTSSAGSNLSDHQTSPTASPSSVTTSNVQQLTSALDHARQNSLDGRLSASVTDTEQDSKESQLSQLHQQCAVILDEQQHRNVNAINSPNSNNGTNASNSTSNNNTSNGNNSGRSKRLRTSFKHNQLKDMKRWFAKNQNPDAKDLKTLAQTTGLSKRVLQVWFQNARAKYRRNNAKVANQQLYDVNQHTTQMLQFQQQQHHQHHLSQQQQQDYHNHVRPMTADQAMNAAQAAGQHHHMY